ncbi:hypothetical protein FH972_002208 [Carpinus fangiana]|uniref:Leucine-rich repeat-containing N-terminal plant-type domain-containing protein n=1 Tax=Carpinus fangiana TaxID=176857 RepID=A0A5N6QE57_9ROSI|nr:hypothetical protein FH972_002208 [Carpinus fangiana]
MAALIDLDLSSNKLEGPIPKTFGNMVALVDLDLSHNKLEGRMYSLQTLHFQNNNFFRELPKSLMNYSSLKLLDVGANRLSRRVPTWTGPKPTTFGCSSVAIKLVHW